MSFNFVSFRIELGEVKEIMSVDKRIIFFLIHEPSPFALYSSASLYCAMQHVKLHWCFPWEVILTVRSVCSLLMTGMQALCQCM